MEASEWVEYMELDRCACDVDVMYFRALFFLADHTISLHENERQKYSQQQLLSEWPPENVLFARPARFH